ncbi:tetratricopeptide repeat protein [Pseudomonas sp. H9]|uniref:tetratricopeptide repeat protein n=1 Tax=Pseudomonas sp. H9 TaxID=483968 RepID=UPI001057D7C2|nr:tetratricopeptide repeat protein [Pseudomonas sp. H9]TDF81478.1 sel1 repeat family protein [Pseudomonas sp. H9]
MSKQFLSAVVCTMLLSPWWVEAGQPSSLFASWATPSSMFEAGETRLPIKPAKRFSRTEQSACRERMSPNPGFIEYLQESAEKGDIKAQMTLGHSYRNGDYLDKADPERAAYWFKKAADQGDLDAQVVLGTLYDKGEGVPQNHEQAVILYQLAATSGDQWGQVFLGQHYLTGRGVKKSVKLGRYWLRKAADQGNGPAKEMLGKLPPNSN